MQWPKEEGQTMQWPKENRQKDIQISTKLFITYYQVCTKSNTTGTTCGTGTAYHSGAHAFTPGF
jgi:hypothetical protein